jgi:bifunctional polynucleotide phosphatase/kinase
VSQKVKLPEKVSWRTIESSLIVGRYNASDDRPAPSGKTKVAAFDFDSTLIGTISKSTFSRSADDWCWWHGTVPAKLKALHDDGFTIIVMSNQNGISLKAPKVGPKVIKVDRFTSFKQKATAVFNALNLPISLYAATEKDRFRKPAVGMWQQFLLDHNLKHEDVDHEHSLFVGDAGGRLAGTFNGKVVKKDFSCSDRLVPTRIYNHVI